MNPEWLTAISLTTYVVFRIGAIVYNTVAVYRATQAHMATAQELYQLFNPDNGPDTERSAAHAVN